MTALELIEKHDLRGHIHTIADYKETRGRLARRPDSLDDRDLAIISFFAGDQRAAEAIAARDAARGHVDPAPVAAPARAAVQFPDELWDVDASDQVAAMETWSLKYPMRVLPIRLWWGFVKVARSKREALEQRVSDLERRLGDVEARPALKDGGDWAPGEYYAAGAAVRMHGSIWVCRENHVSTGTDLDHGKFRLWIKRQNAR